MKIELYHDNCTRDTCIEFRFSDSDLFKYRELNLHQLITKDPEIIIRYLCYIADKIRSEKHHQNGSISALSNPVILHAFG
jgi:hypothetical protein